ncbi:MAG: GNAT family N-acetyltransferase [Coriobacteriia bacterium]|nr:GNAT family N-acetyltransferase [Coriobacteriia bacterium]
MRIDNVAITDVTQDMRGLIYDQLFEPWGVPNESDWLRAGDGGEFFVARDEQGRILGVTRIMPSDIESPGHPTPVGCNDELRLCQVVVDPTVQRHGIGSALMQKAEERALGLGIMRVGVSSRYQAYGFYTRNGYVFYGDEYISPVTHIPYRYMTKKLCG